MLSMPTPPCTWRSTTRMTSSCTTNASASEFGSADSGPATCRQLWKDRNSGQLSAQDRARSQTIRRLRGLARWPHKPAVFVPPEMFISAMETDGLIYDFTCWAIDRARGQCAQWQRQGGQSRLPSTCRSRSFSNSRFVDYLRSVLAASPHRTGSFLKITRACPQWTMTAVPSCSIRFGVWASVSQSTTSAPVTVAFAPAPAPGERAEDRPFFRDGYGEVPRRPDHRRIDHPTGTHNLGPAGRR